MFSKFFESAGFCLLAVGAGMILGAGAGVIVGGLALVLMGATTDDEAIRRALPRVRRRAKKTATAKPGSAEMVPCVCGGKPECQLCFGAGVLPNPDLTFSGGPHPPLIVDPEVEEMARRLAERRELRGNGRIREGAR